jgi:hypothetical protein
LRVTNDAANIANVYAVSSFNSSAPAASPRSRQGTAPARGLPPP